MKISTFVRCISVAFIAALCVQTSSAQSPANSSGMSPDKQMGVGLTAGNSLGGHFAYALNPGFHVGAGFGVQLHSESFGGSSRSNNTIFFAPYAKFILSGMKDMKPYFFGSFGITSGPDNSGLGTETSSTKTGLGLGAGAEYFASRNVGIYGHLSVISLGFGEHSSTDIGLLSPQVGIEWFFNP